MNTNAKFCLISILATLSVAAVAAEVPIPRSVEGDKGSYFLLERKKVGGIVHTLHKRTGPSGTNYTKTEINCSSRQMRVVGEADEDLKNMTKSTTKWFDLVEGSSKSDLFHFVCSK
jgi:hypothetical protein